MVDNVVHLGYPQMMPMRDQDIIKSPMTIRKGNVDQRETYSVLTSLSQKAIANYQCHCIIVLMI